MQRNLELSRKSGTALQLRPSSPRTEPTLVAVAKPFDVVEVDVVLSSSINDRQQRLLQTRVSAHTGLPIELISLQSPNVRPVCALTRV